MRFMEGQSQASMQVSLQVNIDWTTVIWEWNEDQELYLVSMDYTTLM